MADVKISDLSAASTVDASSLFEIETPSGPASEKGTGAQILAYISAAILAAANTFSAKQTFTDFIKMQRALEKVTITADNPASGDNNFDVKTQSFQYYTTANDTNWTLNVRGDGSSSLDSLMATSEALTIALMVTNTGTPYYQNGFKIDGSSVTPQWLGAAAPSAGTANKRDTYTFTIIKTGSATFIVQASFAGGN